MSRQIVDADQSRVQQRCCSAACQVLLALAAAYYRRPSAAWARVPAAVIEPLIRAAPDTRHQHQPINEGVKDSLDYGGPVPGIKQCLKCRPPPCHGLVPPSRRLVAQETQYSCPPHLTFRPSTAVVWVWACVVWTGRGEVEDKQCPALLMASRHTTSPAPPSRTLIWDNT